MPEEFIGKWLKKIKPQWKTAFFAAAVFSLLTHLYIFTNYLPHHDGIIRIHTPQWGFQMGRFFLSPFSGIGSFFDLPLINGILSVFYLALTAAVLTELFGLKKKISIILTAGLLSTFPVVSATMSYMYTVDGYMLASLVTALSLLITSKYKYGFLPGAFLLYLGVGVYQANLPFLLTLATVLLIKEILFSRSSLKDFLRSAVPVGLLVILSMAFYYLTFKLYTNFFSGELLDYQGFDEVVGGSTGLLESIPLIIRRVLGFFFRGFGPDWPVNLYEVLNVLLFILIGIAIFAAVIENRIHRNGRMLAIAILLAVSLPFSSYSLYFISPDIWYHMLMVLALISFYLLPVVIYDNLEVLSFLSKFTSWSTVLLLLVIIFNFAVIANISYLNMNLKFEKSQALAQRIVDRVEQTEGFERDTPIAIFGRLSIDSEISLSIEEKIPPLTGSMHNVLLRDPLHFQSMADNFLGAPYEFILDEDILLEISRSEEYEDMDAWPAASSVRLAGGVLIVKLVGD